MRKVTKELPPLVPCAEHAHCATDPINGDHVDTDTGKRSKNLERRTFRDRGYHCRGYRMTRRPGKPTICENCGMEFGLNDYPADDIEARYRDPEARAGYYAGLKIPEGWAVAHTGGNCTALEYEYKDGEVLIGRALITDDASVPDRASDPCTLGIYDREDQCVIYFECRNLREALMIADRVFVEGGIGV